MSESKRERLWWIAALGLIVLIYSTLYVARGPVDFLRARGLLRVTVGAVFAISALGTVFLLWKRGLGRREAMVLLVFGLVFFGAVLLAPMPEEKLHFLEYGLLGGLLFHACGERAIRLGRGAWGAAVTAILLAGLAGWGDEGIQAILPNRHYDPRDIIWNLLGSSIVILALYASAAARRHDLRRQASR